MSPLSKIKYLSVIITCLYVALWSVEGAKTQSFFQSVESEYSSSKTHKILQKMERFLSDGATRLKMDYKALMPPKLVLLEEQKSFYSWIKDHPRFMGAKYSGGFYSSIDNMILLFGDLDDSGIQKAYHELTHFLIKYRFKHFPKLIEEGLCAYTETVSLNSQSVRYGEIHSGYMRILETLKTPLQMDQLKAYLKINTYAMGTRDEVFGGPEYSQGWAIVWYGFHASEASAKNMQRYLTDLTHRDDKDGSLFIQYVIDGEDSFFENMHAWIRGKKKSPKKFIDFWVK